MNNDMESADSLFLAPDDFPMPGGERMCPRCQCCTVGVAPYEPPVEFPGPGIRRMRFIPEAASLLSEPSGSGDEAWFCYGGCNEKGKHPENKGRGKAQSPLPSLIGRVRK
jgi:hypothetical protein